MGGDLDVEAVCWVDCVQVLELSVYNNDWVAIPFSAGHARHDHPALLERVHQVVDLRSHDECGGVGSWICVNTGWCLIFIRFNLHGAHFGAFTLQMFRAPGGPAFDDPNHWATIVFRSLILYLLWILVNVIGTCVFGVILWLVMPPAL